MEEQGGDSVSSNLVGISSKILNSALTIYSTLLVPPMADKCLSRRVKTRKGMIKEMMEEERNPLYGHCGTVEGVPNAV